MALVNRSCRKQSVWYLRVQTTSLSLRQYAEHYEYEVKTTMNIAVTTEHEVWSVITEYSCNVMPRHVIISAKHEQDYMSISVVWLSLYVRYVLRIALNKLNFNIVLTWALVFYVKRRLNMASNLWTSVY